MYIRILHKQRLRQGGILLLFLGAAVLLLRFPAAVATGVSRGLAVCGEVIIPSLFPFLVLSGVFIHSGTAAAVGHKLENVARRVFNLSGNGAAVLLIGAVGGYPAGAAAVRDLLERREIDEKEATRLLWCCVNGGPAFIIGTVGARLLGSAYKGVLLYIAHLLASLMIALFSRRFGTERKQNVPPARKVPFSTAFSAAVARAVTAVLGMSGFVLLFSAVLTLSDATDITSVMFSTFTNADVPSAVWAAFWEVSCGAVGLTSCRVAGIGLAFLLGAALGWGGVSVLMQIRGMFSEHALPWKNFYSARAIHALLGGAFSGVLFWVMPMPQTTAAVAAPLYTVTAVHPFSVSAAASAALMLLCGGVMLSAARE